MSQQTEKPDPKSEAIAKAIDKRNKKLLDWAKKEPMCYVAKKNKNGQVVNEPKGNLEKFVDEKILGLNEKWNFSRCKALVRRNARGQQ